IRVVRQKLREARLAHPVELFVLPERVVRVEADCREMGHVVHFRAAFYASRSLAETLIFARFRPIPVSRTNGGDMPQMEFSATRRRFILGTGMAGLAALASCRSVLPTVEGAGVSASAASHLDAIRRNNGLAALTPDGTLERAAVRQAGYMAVSGRMEHTALRGRDFVSRMREAGIEPPAAENLAWGRMDLDRLFATWMSSPPHRKNMLDPRFTRFGLAYASDGNGARYWSLNLAG